MYSLFLYFMVIYAFLCFVRYTFLTMICNFDIGKETHILLKVSWTNLCQELRDGLPTSGQDYRLGAPVGQTYQFFFQLNISLYYLCLND